MKRVKIRETGPLSLEMKLHGGKTERLAITDPDYPRTELACELFRSYGTMQLIAPYLPQMIDTDFPLLWRAGAMITEMYESCAAGRPTFTEHPLPRMKKWDLRRGRKARAIISYSAGKDSLHSTMWAQKKYGPDSVMPVHIGGLNTSNAAGERKWAYRQANVLGFPHFCTVELKSSGKCTRNGFDVMRSRDIFMTAILVPVALQFEARYIITEGFAEAGEDEPFTGNEDVLEMLNNDLEHMGIPVRIIWKNVPEMDVIRELYEGRPGWMPEVHNCFTIPCYKIGIRKSWNRRTPNWPLYDSQCGSCSKCRITRLAQLRFDYEGMGGVKPKEIRVFLKDTARYTIEQWRLASKDKFNRRDMLNTSFRYHLSVALLDYDLKELNLRLVETLTNYDAMIPAA